MAVSRRTLSSSWKRGFGRVSFWGSLLAELTSGSGYAVDKQFKFGVEVLNLFNRRVDDITYFYASRLQGEPAAGVEDKHFHPAEPRSLRLSAVVHF